MVLLDPGEGIPPLLLENTYPYAVLNAVRFTPEPVTMGLLSLGFADMAVLRRRRRRA